MGIPVSFRFIIPTTCALLAKAGLQSKLVHYDYGSHIAGNDGTQGDVMEQNTLEAANRYGFNTAVFFNDMKNLNGAPPVPDFLRSALIQSPPTPGRRQASHGIRNLRMALH